MYSLKIGRYGKSKIRAHLHLEICTLRLLYSTKLASVFVSVMVSDNDSPALKRNIAVVDNFTR